MKEPEFQTDFDIFWAAYPSVRRMAKKDALKAWRKLAPDTETVQKILDALTWQTKTDQWKRGIIPLPATYLRGERWEDERTSPPVRQGSAPPLAQQDMDQLAANRKILDLIKGGMDRQAAIHQVGREMGWIH